MTNNIASVKFVFKKSKSRNIVEHIIKLNLVCDQNQCSFIGIYVFRFSFFYILGQSKSTLFFNLNMLINIFSIVINITSYNNLKYILKRYSYS